MRMHFESQVMEQNVKVAFPMLSGDKDVGSICSYHVTWTEPQYNCFKAYKDSLAMNSQESVQ